MVQLSAMTARIFAYVGRAEKRQICSLHKESKIGYKTLASSVCRAQSRVTIKTREGEMLRKYSNFVLRSFSAFDKSTSATHLLSIALLVIVLCSLGCANQTGPTSNVPSAPTSPPFNNASSPPTNPAVTLPVQVTKLTQNPLLDLGTAANLGKPLYQANCALCHGDSGASDGPASSSFNPKPTDLTKGEVTTDPDGELFLVIKNGKGKMPGMKRLTDEQIWQVVAFTRTLTKK